MQKSSMRSEVESDPRGSDVERMEFNAPGMPDSNRMVEMDL